jgi:hypothetical protein
MKQEIFFEIIELEANTYHPLIRAEFSGLEDHWWVIDTGASKSVFDGSLTTCYRADEDDAVMATGLGKEVVETNSGTIMDFTLDGRHFGTLKVALVDFQHINDEYAKFSDKKIVGLIGCDFLFAQKAILNFEQKMITLFHSPVCDGSQSED